MSLPRSLGAPLAIAGGAGALLLSVMFAQALHMNKIMPRFPPAEGPGEGVVGDGLPTFRVVLLGESTVAGTGAPTHEQALSGRMAAMVAEETGQTVSWRALGRNGVTAAVCAARLAPALEGDRADLLVVSLGVNDIILVNGPHRFTDGMHRLIETARGHLGDEVPVLVSGVPPLGCFPAFPQPLRTLVHLRSRQFDRALRAMVDSLPNVWHVPIPFRGDQTCFSADRFHPSPIGYALWAELMRPTLRQVLTSLGAAAPRRGVRV